MRCAHAVASHSSKGRSSGEPKCLRSRISTGVRTDSLRILFTERPAKVVAGLMSATSRAALSHADHICRELERRRKSSLPSTLRQMVSAGQEPRRAAVIFQLTPWKRHLTKPRKLRGAVDSLVLEVRRRQNTAPPRVS